MTIVPPRLDDRSFEELVRETRSRIPLYLPAWTDVNESDPGITLLQLQAWLAETILYRLNQLPDLNYLKFLELLGVDARPASAAQVDLTFTLSDSVSSPEILVPKGAIVAVADPDLPEPVFFETDRTVTVIGARLALVVQSPPPGEGGPRDVTQANGTGRTFLPFCGGYDDGGTCVTGAVAGAYLLLAFASPLPFSRAEIGLQLDLAEEGEALLAGPATAVCGDLPAADEPVVAWEWWDGTGWSALDVTGDETERLTQSGQVYFTVPGQMPAVPAQAVAAEPAHAPPGLADVAGISPEHEALLAAADVATVAQLAALTDDQLLAILEDALADLGEPERAELVAAILADARRLGDLEEPRFYWLRVRLVSGTYDTPPKLDRVAANTVRATAARTVLDEVVGSSNGRPNQTLALGNRPVLAEPPLELEVLETSAFERWEQVDDFAESDPEARHYRLDRARGEITFGDGRRGRIPPAGQGNVVARRYRFGGGSVGNVGASTITDLLTPVSGVDTVTNFRQAEGGQDEEPLEETKLRVPREVLKSRSRAVTLEDFEMLALGTPGARIARAHAHVETTGSTRSVVVVVIPLSGAAKPVPGEQALRLVCRHLDQHRLLTTRLRVQGPAYRDLDVALDVRANADTELRAVKNAVVARLQRYLHPLSGGPRGQGLSFGRTVAHSELVREVMAEPGVGRVPTIEVRKFLAGYPSEPAASGALAADVAAEQAAFEVDCPLRGEVVAVVAPLEGDGAVETTWFTVAVYDCCDVPLAADELPALRQADVAVRYDRSGAGP
jgi:predicted flap endonuclease-1-like 5' DNA nuclease